MVWKVGYISNFGIWKQIASDITNYGLTGRVSHIASSVMVSSSPGIRALHILNKEQAFVTKGEAQCCYSSTGFII